MHLLPHTSLSVFPLCLGTNVFGWTADAGESFAVLSAYRDAGGNFIDTADMYSEWADGHVGGESETIIGRYVATHGCRDEFVIATKVAKLSSRKGLSPDNIVAAAEDSLRRLRTDYIDLYYAHEDDPSVPVADCLGAFQSLIDAGKVRYVGASNFSAERLAESLRIAAAEKLPRYVAAQNQYSLLARDAYEGALARCCEQHELSMFPYWALASGFLTGKYRGGARVDSPRAEGMERFADLSQAPKVLAAIETIAQAQGTSMAAVALAWCATHPTIPSVIASARNVPQLKALLPMAEIHLSAEDKRHLDVASGPKT